MSMWWSVLINVFLPSSPWIGTRRADLFMPLFSTFLHSPKWAFFVHCAGEVLKCCCSVWVSFRQDDISAGECLKSLDIMEGEQPFVLPVLLFIGATDSRLPFSLSLPASYQVSHLHFSYTALFCPKQTHICAVRVMVATSEGSVLDLYLELWPSQSAAVPAMSTPMESPANPAHHKALVRIFKSLHPLHRWSHLLLPDTHTHIHTQLEFNSKHTCQSQDDLTECFVFSEITSLIS